MSLSHVRDYYGVPAELNARIRFFYCGVHEGRIVGAEGGHLLVRFDGNPNSIKALHPTWNVEYLGETG